MITVYGADLIATLQLANRFTQRAVGISELAMRGLLKTSMTRKGCCQIRYLHEISIPQEGDS